MKERAVRLGKSRKTHGMSKTEEYGIWINMRARCSDPTAESYANYGARGICVCPMWANDFTQFYKDMGARPSPMHSIERIDNDGNYEPDNCTWATPSEQASNRRPRSHNKSPRSYFADKRGEESRLAKLTEEQVREIKRLHKIRSREFGARAMARKYGVSDAAIRLIIKGRNWSHVK